MSQRRSPLGVVFVALLFALSLPSWADDPQDPPCEVDPDTELCIIVIGGDNS